MTRLTITTTSVFAVAALSWLGWMAWQSLRNERAAQNLAATRAAASYSRTSQTLASEGGNGLQALGYACRAAEIAPPDDGRQDLYLQRLLVLA